MSEPHPPNPARLRREYRRDVLAESTALPDPIQQFARWFEDATKFAPGEANAMVVATADPSGIPSARVMLLKGFDSRGFVFFTNHSSRKAQEIEQNPRAALVFFWNELERQVRVEGTIAKVSAAETREYFLSRPRESQIGTWASHQSREISSRQELEKRRDELAKQFAAGEISVPDFWGGYRVEPHTIEFWQGRPGRLHDRLAYRRHPDSTWKIVRLEP